MVAQVGLAGALAEAAASGARRKPITTIYTTGKGGGGRGRGGGGTGGAGLSDAGKRTEEAKAGIAEGNKTLKDYQVAQAKRDEEIAGTLHKGNIKQATGEQERRANKLLIEQHGDIYKAYGALGPEAAASLLNSMKSNEVTNAHSVIPYQDDQGRQRLKFVDRAGNVVESTEGPVDVSVDAMEAITAPAGEFKAVGGAKGGFTYHTGTGKVGERIGGRGGSLLGGATNKQLESAEKFFRSAAEKKFGFDVSPTDEKKLKADRQSSLATAMYRQALAAGNQSPDRNAIILTANRAMRNIEADARKFADQEYDERASAFRSDTAQFGMSESDFKDQRIQQYVQGMVNQLTGRGVPDEGAGLGRGQPGQTPASPGQAPPEAVAGAAPAPQGAPVAPQPGRAGPPDFATMELQDLRAAARKEPEAYAELARRAGFSDEEIAEAMKTFFGADPGSLQDPSAP